MELKTGTKTGNPNSQQDPNANPANQAEAPIRVDGFAQVLAMLKIADDDFRESLLRRLAARDRNLALQLKAELEAYGIY